MRHLVLLAMLAPAAIFGQEFRGTISGSVVDAQNAIVPNTKIEATETRTGAKSVAVSDSTGKYAIPFLAPGTYQVFVYQPEPRLKSAS